jgi:hypothetical protein
MQRETLRLTGVKTSKKSGTQITTVSAFILLWFTEWVFTDPTIQATFWMIFTEKTDPGRGSIIFDS